MQGKEGGGRRENHTHGKDSKALSLVCAAIKAFVYIHQIILELRGEEVEGKGEIREERKSERISLCFECTFPCSVKRKIHGIGRKTIENFTSFTQFRI
jgi:hypothetical protein